MKEIIYKYVDFNGLECLLENGTLKFSKPDDFNDPFEFHDALVDKKLKLKHWIQIYREREGKLSKERLKQLGESFRKKTKKFKIILFSNLTMRNLQQEFPVLVK